MDFMRQALAWAEVGEGGTRPNPPVGCVIVLDNDVIGHGYHEYAGGRHAEAIAIDASGEKVRGAEMYVTLEPCSTIGLTPPCTEAIIRAGIKRVVIAAIDKNPKHNGNGIQKLRNAGIEVLTGVCEQEAQKMLAPFFKLQLTGRPYVSLKMAQSFDGGIADHAGNSKWISCEESRREVRNLRRKSDVVLVGRGTVLADNPSLLRSVEDDGKGLGLPGMRAVLDSTGSLPLTSQIFTDGRASQTIYVTTGLASQERIDAVKAAGAQVMVLPNAYSANEPEKRKISLSVLFEKLGDQGYMSVLCEGGSELASALINECLVDELFLFIAPIVLGADSKRVFGAYPFDLPTAPRFEIHDVTRSGGDMLVRAYPKD